MPPESVCTHRRQGGVCGGMVSSSQGLTLSWCFHLGRSPQVICSAHLWAEVSGVISFRRLFLCTEDTSHPAGHLLYHLLPLHPLPDSLRPFLFLTEPLSRALTLLFWAILPRPPGWPPCPYLDVKPSNVRMLLGSSGPLVAAHALLTGSTAHAVRCHRGLLHTLRVCRI